METRPEQVCVFQNHWRYSKAAKDCSFARNPGCKYFISANVCKNGGKRLYQHKANGGIMAVRAPLSKCEVSCENKKTSDAQWAAAKPKAKAKVKAKAHPKKVKACMMLSKEPPIMESEDEMWSSSSQAR